MDEFHQLYQKYKTPIYRYLFYMTHDTYIAEELTQETFLQAFTSVHRFKGKSKVSTWLYQIAKHTYYNYLKKNPITEADEGHILTDQRTPEQFYEQKEERVLLLQALKKLSAQQQELIILRFYNELSFRDIGDIYKQSDTWARVNVFRAKGKLTQMMERRDEE
ncbi:hypothetical protein KP77_10860 [Jeotgalibacillus alimentarius]|uniref:RNA polymerase sigma factor n=1 Tax=Jeotgalibacillus alimentarius TaxID=135826 RepID=A0A0C2SC97_9BACL|nr:sigma-70 family RNA polymerase sigma factor [Jeotgalibacillus alimentarius]KIL51574.1 hypothetical protein KP77_10860 [Jeotgalibacillus alimentarius]